MTAPLSRVGVREQSTGYWTPARMRLWDAMPPADRDHDRYVGVYPPGQGACETPEGRLAIEQRAEADYDDQHGCSCHLSAPCSHCTDCPLCHEENR